jgi:N utilization substance protein B
MLYAADPTPAAVAIDEAVELARRFGSADSPAFVNGILDKLVKARAAEGGTVTEGPADPADQPPAT